MRELINHTYNKEVELYKKTINPSKTFYKEIRQKTSPGEAIMAVFHHNTPILNITLKGIHGLTVERCYRNNRKEIDLKACAVYTLEDLPKKE